MCALQGQEGLALRLRQRMLLQVHEGCNDADEPAASVCCTADGGQTYAWVAHATADAATPGMYVCHDHDDDEEHVAHQIATG